MIKRYILLFLSFWLCLSAYGQPEVRIGRHRIVPVRNVEASRTRGAAQESLGEAVGGYRNVLVQLEASFTDQEQLVRLSELGVRLTDYLGGHAYYALLAEGVKLTDLRGSGVVSVMGVQPEWKVPDGLLEGDIPEHARVGEQGVSVMLTFADNASAVSVREAMLRLGAADVHASQDLGFATGTIPLTSVAELARLPYVKVLSSAPMPQVLYNRNGRPLSRANIVKRPASLNGRGLDGSGINVGVWDGNMISHPDFGDRVRQMEYEIPAGAHGTHVAGSILGAGLIDEDGAGMAPAARIYAYNFNVQKNRKPAPLEMLEAHFAYGVSLTSNSYGMPLNCGDWYTSELYAYGQPDQLHDLLASWFDMTLVFAAGNEQDKCNKETKKKWGAPGYGTVTRRTKNAILVGALTSQGGMTSFSSWGPHDDGRLAPTVSTVGHRVYSTVPADAYGSMNGTSMSTPLTTGSIALLMQRYRQLNGGAMIGSELTRALVANTARDAGLPGPDFQYGFGILDIERAILSLENGQFREGKVELGVRKNKAGKEERYVKAFKDTLQVPAGVKQVKVLLTWNDPTPDKVFAFGDRALTNDLDLVVNNVLALFPDPKNVTKPALPVGDHINNIEQVVIANPPAGALPIVVMASECYTPTQSFALAYCFEYDDLRITYPSGGEKLVSGALFELRLDGVTEPYSVEVSYDDGVSFTKLGSLKNFDASNRVANENIRVRMPEDAPLTSKARLRVITKSGRTAVSEFPFTVAPQVENLRIDFDGCGSEGKLTWDKVESAAHGYVVLRASLRDGKFEKVADVAAGTQEYTFTAEAGTGVYSVAVRTSADGEDYGKRAYGVVQNAPSKVSVSATALPFVESFDRPADGRFVVRTGDSVSLEYLQKEILPSQLPVGSNIPVFQNLKKAQIDESDPFGSADHINSIRTCNLDLSGIKDQDLIVEFAIIVQTSNPANAPKVRLKYGDEVLKDVHGHDVLSDARLIQASYLIKGGGTGALSLEFVLLNPKDMVGVVLISVSEAKTEADLAVSFKALPASKPGLGVEKVTGKVRNVSLATVMDIAVEVLLNNESAASVRIPELAPYADIDVELNVDFSSSDPLGTLYDVQLVAHNSGDPTPHNNVARNTVVNFGESKPMGKASFFSFFGFKITMPTRDIYTLKPGERVFFTDAGGAYGPYPEQEHNSWYKFKPSDPSRVVKARVVQLTLHDTSTLVVYPGFVADALTQAYTREVVFTGRTAVNLPLEFTSEAEDGALTFNFKSWPASAEGWIIEIYEVPRVNTLSINPDVSIRKNGKDPSLKTPLKVTVNRLGESSPEDAVLHASGALTSETPVGAFEKGKSSKEIELGEMMLTPMKVKPIRVVLTSNADDDPSDNIAEGVAIYDNYPVPPYTAALPDLGIDLAGVALFDQSVEFASRETRGMTYYGLHEVYYYRNDQKDPNFAVYNYQKGSKLALRNLSIKDGYSVALYVDWHNTGTFTACGTYKGTGNEVKPVEEAVYLDLVGLDGTVQDGMKRARIVLGPDAVVGDPTFKSGSREKSFVYDFRIRVKEGAWPYEDDLAIATATFGTDAASYGEKVDIEGGSINDTYVYVRLVNHGSAPYAGSVKLSLNPDMPFISPVEQTVQLERPIGPYGLDTLELKLELKGFQLGSYAGKRSVLVTLTDPGRDARSGNNSEKAVIFVRRNLGAVLANNALRFQSGTPNKVRDNLTLPEIPTDHELFKNNSGGVTVEFWMFPEEQQFGSVLNGNSQLEVYTTDGVIFNKKPIPDNALAIIQSGTFVAWTTEPVVTLNKWMHVALVFGKIDPDKGARGAVDDFKIYINGKKLDEDKVHIEMQGGTFQFSKLKVGLKFNGAVDEIRLWGKARTDQEIEKNLYKHIASGDAEVDNLFYQFSLDEGAGNRYLLGHPKKGLDKVSAILVPFFEPEGYQSVSEGGVWLDQHRQHPVSSLEVEGADRVELNGDTYTIYLPAGSDPKAVKGKIAAIWPGSTMKIADKADMSGAADLQAQDELFDLGTLDFSASPSKYVQVKKTGLYGKDLESVVILEVEVLRSAACELISFKAGETAVTPVCQTLHLGLEAAPEEALLLTFEVSEGAKLVHKGQTLRSGESKLDVLGTRLLTVVSASGEQSQNYVLTPSIKQKIEGKAKAVKLLYADTVVALDFKATSNLPLIFTSSDATVAVAHDNALHLTGPGKTTITVIQPGNELYAPADPVTFTVEVDKPTILVQPSFRQNNAIPFAARIAWAYVYGGEELVNDYDQFNLPDAQGWAQWRFKDAAGTFYTDQQLLPVGAYEVVPTVAEYEADLYKVKALPGMLTVEPNERVAQYVISVFESDRSTPIPGAYVYLNGRSVRTDESGSKLVALGALAYDLAVRKTGYVPHFGRLVADKLVGEVSIYLDRSDIKLKYVVAANGAIAGEPEQCVKSNGNAEPVRAVADHGYRFVKWDDGLESAQRHDLNVTEEKTYTASFEKGKYTVRYLANAEGAFASDAKVEQEVEFEGTTEAVSANADLATREYFYMWDDGKEEVNRTDKVLAEDATYTALYAPYAKLNVKEGFEGTQEFPAGWYSRNSTYGAQRTRWRVAVGALLINSKTGMWFAALNGNFMVIDGSAKGNGGSMQLLSPRYSLNDITGDEIQVIYNFFYGDVNSSVTFGYRFNDAADFTPVPGVSFKEEQNPKTVVGEISGASGKDWVQFAFTFTSTKGGAGGFGFDDFLVREKSATAGPLEVAVKSSIADAGRIYKVIPQYGSFGRIQGFELGDQITTGKVSVDAIGDGAPYLKAEPNDGFRFIEWKETTGGANKVLTDNQILAPQSVYNAMELTARFEKTSSSFVYFGVYPEGAGSVLRGTDNLVGTREVIEQGQELPAVKAEVKSGSGYKFSHWSTGSKDAELTGYKPTGDMTLVAIFVKETVVKTHEVLITVKYEEAQKEEVKKGVAANATVLFFGEDGNLVASSSTDAKGEAKVSVPEGKYVVKVTLAGFAEMDRSLEVKGEKVALDVILRNGERLFPVEFVVLGVDGTKIEGAAVHVEGDPVALTADDAGVITGFFPYDARLSVYASAAGYVPSLAVEYRVTRDIKGQLVTLYLVKGVELKVTVLREQDGTPLPNALVFYENISYPTDESGVATLVVPAGTFFLGAEAEYHFPAAPVEVTVESGAATAEATIKLTEHRYAVTFRVVDGDTKEKTPLANAKIKLLTFNDVELTTSASGEVEYMLPAGQYAIRVERDGYDYLGKLTIVVDGSPLLVSIELHKPVVLPYDVSPVSEALAGVRVHPNPFEGALYLSNLEAIDAVEVYGLVGNLVAVYELNGEAAKVLSLGHLPSGVYLVRFVSEGESRTVRVVKQ